MPEPKSQNPLDAAERLALGKKLHEKHWPTMATAAAALGIPAHHLYVIQKDYRDSAGIITSKMLGAARGRATRKIKETRDKEGEHRAEIKRRSYEKRKAEKLAEQSAGSNGQLVRLPAAQDVAQYQNRIIELERGRADLEDQLSHALEECQTLQKLLMVVGRTL